MIEYDKSELDEFRRLIELTESHDQMDRIEGRMSMPAFIEKTGRDKCDAMFEVLKKEVGL